MMRRCFVACLYVLALASSHATALLGQSGIVWQPDDRVLLSDFGSVYSITRDNSTLYGVTPNGLLRYDLTSHKFRLPLTIEDGYPAREGPLSAAYSQTDFVVLLGTSMGGLYKLSAVSAHFDDLTRLPGPVTSLVAPRDGFDVYAAAAQSWYRLRSGSFFPEPVQAPPRVQQPGANDPYLRSMLATAGLAPGRGTAEVMAIEADRTDASYFVATRGNGIVQLNTRSSERTRLPYGLNTRGAAALAFWRGRLWFGGDARVLAGPLVSATSGLEDFRDNLPSSGAPQDMITALLATDSALWVGTMSGLYSFGGRPGNERWQSHRMLLNTRVTSLAEAQGTVFVGTDQALLQFNHGALEPVINGRSIYGIAPGRDTLWVATDAGVASLPLQPGVLQASVLRGGGTPNEAVFDVRSVGDTLYAVTRDALFRRGPGGWVAADHEIGSRLGPMGRLRTDGTSVWVLGSLGFSVKGAQSAVWTYYMATDDIPEAPIRDLLPLGSTVWLATPAGALRVRNPR
jgi:ligand-binding sensor domain-containing protein